MRTIIYMAALLLIGVTPLIYESLVKAAFEAADNFYFMVSKWLSGTSAKILGRAC